MAMDTGSKNILARGKTVSVGIDVHKRSRLLAAVSDGVVLFKGTIPPSYEALHSLFDRFVNCKINVSYEAGPSGFGLHDHLDEAGIRCIAAPQHDPRGKRLQGQDRREGQQEAYSSPPSRSAVRAHCLERGAADAS